MIKTKLAAWVAATAAVTVIGGATGGQAVAASSATDTGQTTPTTNSQTLVMDPTKSFAMKATPSVKATPYWGEKKPG
ncbi:MAG: hypothetical protein KDB72_06125 [Mycobacterium sp.]|nr:hypothetical protein [Mycobacterium sp.]